MLSTEQRYSNALKVTWRKYIESYACMQTRLQQDIYKCMKEMLKPFTSLGLGSNVPRNVKLIGHFGIANAHLGIETD